MKNPLTNPFKCGIINTERERKIPNTRKVKIMMNTMYKVTAYGGMDGRRYTEDFYATKEAAYEAVRKETWDDVCDIYEVALTINENGKIKATETKIARPRTAKEIQYGEDHNGTEYID